MPITPFHFGPCLFFNAYAPTRMSYHLGFSGWLAMDPDTLDIEFAADGRFVVAHIVRH